jgi:hypothetical protein
MGILPSSVLYDVTVLRPGSDALEPFLFLNFVRVEMWELLLASIPVLLLDLIVLRRHRPSWPARFGGAAFVQTLQRAQVTLSLFASRSL